MFKLKKWCINLFLALGLLFVFGGFLLFIYAILNERESVLQFWPCFVLLLGILVTYLSVAIFKSSFLFFLGVGVTLSSALSVIISSGIGELKYSELWPVFIIFAAISLISSCFYKHKRLLPKYFIPSVVMFAMGCLFLLFSLHIIKVPLRIFFFYSAPVVLLLSGFGFILFFCVQTQKQKKHNSEENEDCSK